MQHQSTMGGQPSKPFDLLVLIGRFRPFHNGHKHVVDEALKQAHNVLILVGSANRPRTAKNPWTSDEVESMIRSVYPYPDGVAAVSPDNSRINIRPLDDWLHDNDYHWTMDVQREVDAETRRLQQWSGREYAMRVGLVGFSKDQSSYYLKKFPQWGSVDVGGFRHADRILDATSVRNTMLDVFRFKKEMLQDGMNGLRDVLPIPVLRWMSNWLSTPTGLTTMTSVVAATDFAKKYKEDHKYAGGASYEAIHTTADSLFIQSGHILLGRRKFNPGKDLWALPGGFAHAGEPIRETSRRESREETGIKLPVGTIDLSFRFKQVFSDPNRSDDRGRIITHAYLYLLGDRAELPEVAADDDFAEVRWVPLGLLNPREMYSDHFWIIHKMINMIPVD